MPGVRIWSAFARSVLGVVAVALVALPLAGRAAASAAGDERIRSYDVALEVRPDGSLQVAVLAGTEGQFAPVRKEA